MREMYGGTLTVLLDPKIRPWDTIYLFDYVNEMFGPVGVQEVHHHFDYMTGATTTIVPDLIVQQQDVPSLVKNSWMSNLYAQTIGVSIASLALGMGLGTRGGLAGVALGTAAGVYGSFKLGGMLWNGLGGYLMGRDSGLSFSGLWYKGRPFSAGVEGMRRETMRVVLEDKIDVFSEFTKKVLNNER
jgi:hypothetical protein